MKKKIFLPLILALSLTLAGCPKTPTPVDPGDDPSGDDPSGEPTGDVAVSGITLDLATLDLKVGASANLVATVAPADATDKEVVWSSSNPEVASVQAGAVSALSVGTATIKAAAHGDETKYAECVVTVTEDVVPPVPQTPAEFVLEFLAGRGVEGVTEFPAVNELSEYDGFEIDEYEDKGLTFVGIAVDGDAVEEVLGMFTEAGYTGEESQGYYQYVDTTGQITVVIGVITYEGSTYTGIQVFASVDLLPNFERSFAQFLAMYDFVWDKEIPFLSTTEDIAQLSLTQSSETSYGNLACYFVGDYEAEILAAFSEAEGWIVPSVAGQYGYEIVDEDHILEIDVKYYADHSVTVATIYSYEEINGPFVAPDFPARYAEFLANTGLEFPMEDIPFLSTATDFVQVTVGTDYNNCQSRFQGDIVETVLAAFVEAGWIVPEEPGSYGYEIFDPNHILEIDVKYYVNYDLTLVTIYSYEEIYGPYVDPETVVDITVPHFTQVTSLDELDEEGIYAIGYTDEEGNTYVFDGSLAKLDAVNDYVVAYTDGPNMKASEAVMAASFSIKAGEGDNVGKFAIQSASGVYFGTDGLAEGSNGLKESAEPQYVNIAFDEDGNFDVTGDAGHHLRFNPTSGQMRFRFYKASTYTAQKAVQLYKLVDGDPFAHWDEEIAGIIGEFLPEECLDTLPEFYAPVDGFGYNLDEDTGLLTVAAFYDYSAGIDSADMTEAYIAHVLEEGFEFYYTDEDGYDYYISPNEEFVVCIFENFIYNAVCAEINLDTEKPIVLTFEDRVEMLKEENDWGEIALPLIDAIDTEADLDEYTYYEPSESYPYAEMGIWLYGDVYEDLAAAAKDLGYEEVESSDYIWFTNEAVNVAIRYYYSTTYEESYLVVLPYDVAFPGPKAFADEFAKGLEAAGIEGEFEVPYFDGTELSEFYTDTNDYYYVLDIWFEVEKGNLVEEIAAAFATGGYNDISEEEAGYYTFEEPSGAFIVEVYYDADYEQTEVTFYFPLPEEPTEAHSADEFLAYMAEALYGNPEYVLDGYTYFDVDVTEYDDVVAFYGYIQSLLPNYVKVLAAPEMTESSGYVGLYTNEDGSVLITLQAIETVDEEQDNKPVYVVFISATSLVE